MGDSFADLRQRSRMVNQEKPANRFASGGAVAQRAKAKTVVTTGKTAEREMQSMESHVDQPRRQKRADGGPVIPDPGWTAPNLPSISVDSSAGRKGATDFRASYGLGDVSASANYQKATDGGKDAYGGRLTFRKSFAAGGVAKPQRKATGGGVPPPVPSWSHPTSNFLNAPRAPNWIGAKNGGRQTGAASLSAKASPHAIGKAAEREMAGMEEAAARQKAKPTKPARSTKR